MNLTNMLMLLMILATCGAARLPEGSERMPKQFVNLRFEPASSFHSSLYPKYFIYDFVQLDTSRPTAPAIFGDGRPQFAHVSSSFSYYGTPLYDYRIQLSPVFPGASPAFPSYVPQVPQVPQRPPPSTPEIPSYEDDGIEKLDDKLHPSLGTNLNPQNTEDDDTVTIEASESSE